MSLRYVQFALIATVVAAFIVMAHPGGSGFAKTIAGGIMLAPIYYWVRQMVKTSKAVTIDEIEAEYLNDEGVNDSSRGRFE